MVWRVNFFALVATILFFPKLPGKQTSYGDEISKAKTKIFAISAIGLVILTTGVCISYSYISEFLQTITHIVGINLSITLFLFGISSIFGTWLGGKLLMSKPNPTVLIYPFVLSTILFALYLLGSLTIPTVILAIIWGALDGILNNILQYWITSAAPDAPEFANGMFFSMMNVGITIGTSIGGYLIIGYDTNSIFIGSIVVLLLSVLVFGVRVKNYNSIT
ncbi:hypothetical protein [Methanobrevibacter sp.]|uniref:hypothetical protein n=1 Tax=Methanobrevibacter sp. TaxID=66852 RepID=UPI0025DF1940|nr:hypothetical protein [Methanobrevibacter sp.]